MQMKAKDPVFVDTAAPSAGQPLADHDVLFPPCFDGNQSLIPKVHQLL
jgi:hypothetical protein